MSLYDNEENAVVNQTPTPSETPSTLVGEGDATIKELSPNPAKFGFTKQVFIDALSDVATPAFDTLYLVKVKDGGVVVGYIPYRYEGSIKGYQRIYNTNEPNNQAAKGVQEQKAVEVVEPQVAPEKVFNGKVVFNGDVGGEGLKKFVKENAPTPSGGDLDGNVTVEINEEYNVDDYASRTTYSTPISLKDFISNCESGDVYTHTGTIAKINNLIDGHAFRIILIGIEADVLAYDDTTKTKTTWQFLDMPEHQCRLGLPFNVIDWGSTSGRAAANAYLEGTNSDALTWYPSNKGGYITATGLLNVLHTIYEGLPIQLKRAIKTIRKAFNIPRQYRSIAANGGTESDSSGTGYIAQKLFHLSATESGSASYGTEGSAYAYLNSNARRIRFYGGNAAYYWLRTPHPSYSYGWVGVNNDGSFYNYSTNISGGVAPAFCI